MRKVIILILFSLLFIYSAAGYSQITGTGDAQRIDGQNPGDSFYCNSTLSSGAVIGADFNNQASDPELFIDRLFCANFNSTQFFNPTLSGVTVSYSTVTLVGINDAGKTICSASTPVVCGAKNADTHGDRIDNIYCCSANDTFINLSSARDVIFNYDLPNRPAEFPNNIIYQTIECGAGEVMCGVHPAGQQGYADGIECCKYQNESCSVNEDLDHDGLAACADPDCNGKIGPAGQLCQYGGEIFCNDGYDNDGNGLTDMNDPNCLAWANGSSLISASPSPLADTSINSIFKQNPSTYNYNPSSLNGSNGVCGDDILASDINIFGYDYGYIDPITKQYLCYNYIADLSRANVPKATVPSVWEWLNAQSSSAKFNIFTLNNSGHAIDTISNSDTWFYCNANTGITNGLSGTPISDGQSFTAKNGPDKVSCIDIMDVLFPGAEFTACPASGTWNDCCVGNSVVTSDDANSCGDICYAGGIPIATTHPCDANDPVGKFFCSGLQGLAFTSTSSGGNDFVDKNSCQYDMSGCLDTPLNTKDCLADLGGAVCNQDEYCIGGNSVVSFGLASGQSCCYNPSSKAACMKKISTNTEQNCANYYNGIIFNISQASCSGQSISLLNGKYCCLNNVISNVNLIPQISLFSTVSPGAFTCYKEGDDNIISQCIFDNSSVNIDKMSGAITELDYAKGRIKGVGASTHTIRSFDAINLTTGVVVDRIRRLRVVSTGTMAALTEQPYNYFLKDYSYMEFDVSYPSKCSLNVTLTTNNTVSGIQKDYVFDMCKYLTTGDRPMRWNHVMLPLYALGISFGEHYMYLSFDDKNFASGYNIVIDNIKLTPENNNLLTNSASSYCTGGFGTWISSLNPPPSANFSNWDNYGPYEFACEAQGSFDWTGQHCCGFNTRFNYGEFYSDSEKGCFNGSKIQNDWTVSYINNVRENDAGAFESYYYKDLLYYNNAFIGCQIDINNGKYSSLVESFNGTGKDTTSELAKTSINNQCAVVGDYYCANGAWRQLIQTSANHPINFNGQQLQLKTAPAGIELIKNGFDQTCDDGIQNQDETDIDCGGSICQQCQISRSCIKDADCVNPHKCNLGKCVPY